MFDSAVVPIIGGIALRTIMTSVLFFGGAGLPGEEGYPGNWEERGTYLSDFFFILCTENIMEFHNYGMVFEISV